MLFALFCLRPTKKKGVGFPAIPFFYTVLNRDIQIQTLYSIPHVVYLVLTCYLAFVSINDVPEGI